MEGGDADSKPSTRQSLKTKHSFNNYSNWKHKLRENCCKRVRNDRTRLLWKMRLPEAKDKSLSNEEFMKSTFQGIVSDEIRKIKASSVDDRVDPPITASQTDDADLLWEYDGPNAAFQGECDEILLEMQRIFYEDLVLDQTRQEPEICTKTWEDEEDEYLAHAVYEHMQLNDDQVQKKVWCPICKQGELQQNYCHIYCTNCVLKLVRGEEVTLELMRSRLAEAHAEHLERGCRLKPKFRMESRFNITALYLECQGCNIFEVVI